MNNVISFPKQNVSLNNNGNQQHTLSKEEINDNLEQNRQYHIQETIAFLTPIIFSHLNIAGFSPNGEDEFSIKEGAFIVEAIRSHMFSHYGLKHPFQKIVDKVFIKEEGDPEGVLTIARDIKVTLDVSN